MLNKMDYYNHESKSKVIQDEILNKMISNNFQLGHGIKMGWPLTKITSS